MATRGDKMATASGIVRVSSVLEALLDLEKVGENIFRGNTHQVPWGRIYGGQLVAQGLMASYRTVREDFIAHSVHAMFLRPGRIDKPVVYVVDRVRDGRAFCARAVRGYQNGKCVYTGQASFQLSEKGVSHQAKMPRVDPPDSDSDRPWTWNGVSMPLRHMRVRDSSRPLTTREKGAVPQRWRDALRGDSKQQAYWVRSAEPVQDSLRVQQCVLAYVSDWRLLSTSLKGHGIGTDKKVVQVASLDHTVYFHAPARTDEWMLFETSSPRSVGGRGLVFGRFFTRGGVHVATVSQEGLIRTAQLKDEKPIKSKL